MKKPLAEKPLKIIVRLLLLADADYRLKNKQGRTPLDIDVQSKAFLEAEIENAKQEKMKKHVVLRINDEAAIEALLKAADTFA